ncbi:hypothetical protein M427DRAFT_142474 [Gonapodya prolifera JEL478]|uniref:RING-type E3 ubiquitin transferase n=1 Tax=Gonapodya prolifera (strain JEL478) TaxID=1344416 RepID=A0A139AXH4_GONPJ|nr:hypothetical protein M427DRAFT_142474 [Gonapodya prolifera JEL478]|eukprot:KXS21420.1 hypothetical protein M427DRAFT_142474 [Gonapodya prolifera JEL478]
MGTIHHDDDEEEFCRVCRAGTEDSPLYHPCKCSGSMRYVHQECLEEWLSHSGKKNCEICGHTFNFSPIYATPHPPSLTPSILIRHFIRSTFSASNPWIRFPLAALVWLVVVPYSSAAIWRGYWDPKGIWEQLGGLIVASEDNLPPFLPSLLLGHLVALLSLATGVCLLILREYIVVNTNADEAEALVGEEPEGFPADLEHQGRPVEVQNELDGRAEMDRTPGHAPHHVEGVADSSGRRGMLHVNHHVDKTGSEHASAPFIQTQPDREEAEETNDNNAPTHEPARGDDIDRAAKGKAPAVDYLEQSPRAGLPEPMTTVASDSRDKGKGRAEPTVSPGLVPQELSPNQGGPSDTVNALVTDNPSVNATHSPLRESVQPLPQVFRPRPPPNPPIPAQPPPQIANRPAPEPPILPPPPPDEPMEPLAILDLLGVRGPLAHLMQNAFLVLAVVAAVVGGGVWWPFAVGRMVASGAQVLVGPLEVMNKAKIQKVVEGFLKLSSLHIEWPRTAKSIVPVAQLLTSVTRRTKLLLSSFPSIFSSYLPAERVVRAGRVLNSRFWPVVMPGLTWVATTSKEIFSQVSDMSGGAASAARKAIFGETRAPPTIGPLGPQVTPDPWSPEDRVRHVVLGYVVLIVAAIYYGWQAGLLDHPHVKTAWRLAGRWARYVGVSVKVAVFIFIELVAFPLMCGVLVDLCTLPIFGPTATPLGRLAFHRAHPWTSSFLHWLAGTTYMFQFALYVSTVKKIVRKGVMWFIRDPNDPQFHPMMDIVERPVVVQLRKLGVSAFMYGVMVAGGVGGYVYGTKWLDQHVVSRLGSGPWRIWPLKWELSETISEFPIELLTFHLLFPAFIQITKPSYWLQLGLEKWFEWTARRLRLTSFLFGGTHRDEESDIEDDGDVDDEEEVDEQEERGVQEGNAEPNAHGGPSETDTRDSSVAAGSGSTADSSIAVTPSRVPNRREFRYMRVPNRDYVEVVRGERMLVPWREGDPLRGRDTETPEDVEANWRLVYVPAMFKFRIYILLIWQWLSAVSFLFFAVNLPLTVGRAIFIRLDDVVDFASHRNAFTTLILARGSTSISSENLGQLQQEPVPVLPAHGGVRPDLPVHDVYSLAVGLCCLGMVLGTIRVIYSRNSKWLDRLGRLLAKPLKKLIKVWGSLTKGRRRRMTTGATSLGRTWYQPFLHAGQRLRRQRKARSLASADGMTEDTASLHGTIESHSSRKRRTWMGRLAPISPRAYLGWLSRQTLALGMGAGRMRRRVIWFRLREDERGLWRERLAVMFQLIAKMIVLTAFVGVIIPLMVGTIFELYIIMPLRSPRDQTPINFLVQDYALGVVYLKIFYSLLLIGPETPLARAVIEARDSGFHAFNLSRFTNNVLFPVTATCLVLICAPTVIGWLVTWLAVWAFRTFVKRDEEPANHDMDVLILEQLVLRYIFPGVLVLGLSAEAADGLFKLGRTWVEKVRDEQFLVGRRLHNLESEPRGSQPPGGKQEVGRTHEPSNSVDTDHGEHGESSSAGIPLNVPEEERDNFASVANGENGEWIDEP